MVKRGFLFYIGNGDSLMAEKWAILMGLKWNWDMLIRHLVKESDCLEIIDVLNKQVEVEKDACLILVEIFQFINRGWDLHFVWCPRKRNKVVDRLSSYAFEVG